MSRPFILSGQWSQTTTGFPQPANRLIPNGTSRCLDAAAASLLLNRFKLVSLGQVVFGHPFARPFLE